MITRIDRDAAMTALDRLETRASVEDAGTVRAYLLSLDWGEEGDEEDWESEGEIDVWGEV